MSGDLLQFPRGEPYASLTIDWHWLPDRALEYAIHTDGEDNAVTDPVWIVDHLRQIERDGFDWSDD